MPLVYIRDDLEDTRHTELDDLIFRVLGFTPEILPNLPPGQVLTALYNIVKHLPEKLDQRYESMNALERLIEEFPEIIKLTHEAYRSRTFRNIRNLEILQASRQRKTKGPHLAEQDITEQKTATLKAWDAPFIGKAHELLAMTIHAMNKSRGMDPYANYLPIIQSSGTGKSRTVHELARLVFTIPFNLRNQDESSGYAFPEPDSSIRDYLTRNRFSKNGQCENDQMPSSYEDIMAGFVLFFAELFKTVRVNLKRNIKRQSTTETLATAWREYLNQRKGSGTSSSRVAMYDQLQDALGDRKRSQSKDLDALITEAMDEVKELENAIDSLLDTRATDHDVRILLYFDEAHSLTNIPVINDTNSRNRYDVLCAALSHLRSCPLFAITLSTNSKLSQLSPSKRAHPSNRILEGKDSLQAPFTELPFDCLEDGQPLIRPNEMTLAQVAEVGFMVKFGRPLFLTRWNSAQPESAVRRDMIDFARAKLARRTGHLVGQDDKDEHVRLAWLAALSTRLLLEFEPRREAALLTEARLVEGNMRIAYSVPKHREYLRSGAPSEPILAEAAAQEMNKMAQPIPDILANFVRDGLLDKGEAGELVMRLLLTQAWDLAAKKTCARDGVSLSFSRAVHLFDFLRELFGGQHLQAILTSNSDNDAKGGTFKEAFKNAYIRFSHFARNGKDNNTTTHAAWAAVARGMAVQCSRNQDLIDAVLPLVLRDETLCEEIMSGILIQVKNKKDAEVIVIDEAEVGQGTGFFPKNKPNDRRPYITLVMQLGIQTKASRDAFPAAVPTTPKKTNAPKPRPYQTPAKLLVRVRKSSRGVANHPRYPIYVHGCSSSVYQVVQNKDQYALLLRGRDLLEEHPRQSSGSLSAVRRFKYAWNLGPDCYDWIDDLKLNEIVEDANEPEDGLYIGPAAVDIKFIYPNLADSDSETG